MKRYGLPIILTLVAGIMITIFVIGNNGKPADKPTDSNVQIDEKQYPDQGQKHLAALDEQHEAYNSNPPSSGPHAQSPTPWGIKDGEIADEILIHNLEHGGIEIAYRPDLPAAEIQKLKDLFNQLPVSQQFNRIKAVLVPRSKNEHPISLVAWTYVMHLDSVDGAKIRQFYLNHLDKGPELVP